MIRIRCRCGSFVSDDGYEFRCTNCNEVYLPQYVSDGEDEIYLTKALEHTSNDSVRIRGKEHLHETARTERGKNINILDYEVMIYTLEKRHDVWILENIEHITRTFKSPDPNVISDELIEFRDRIDTDFYTPDE